MPSGSVTRSATEVDRDLATAGARTSRRVARSGSSCTGTSPFLSALLRKMSAKDKATTARKPWSRSAHTACSREEPQPKFRPATSTWAPARLGPVQHELGPRLPGGIAAPVGEEVLAQAVPRWSP